MEKCVSNINGFAIFDHTNDNNGFYVLITKGRRRYFWSLGEAEYWCKNQPPQSKGK